MIMNKCNNEFDAHTCQLCNHLNLKLIGTRHLIINTVLIEVTCTKGKFDTVVNQYLQIPNDEMV